LYQIRGSGPESEGAPASFAVAVYLGGRNYSLRARAGNFDDQGLYRAVDYAHQYGVRVYVTLNIFAHNRDLDGLEDYLLLLENAGVDGLIVADPGILFICNQVVPGLPIHLSTQANVTNGASARFWAAQGIGRLNLARELGLDEIIALRRHFRNAADYARQVHCFIPNFTVNIKKLIDDYRNSRLYRFHQWFDQEKQHPPAEWADTYDRINLAELPPCVRTPLEQPNDLLLKPTNLQTITRVLLARGWHPQHIAGLVHSRWVNGPGWPPDQWKHFDAGSRSAFYVRIFSGLMADGLDGLVDQALEEGDIIHFGVEQVAAGIGGVPEPHPYEIHSAVWGEQQMLVLVDAVIQAHPPGV
jgi:hypothetical protein